MSLRSPSCLAIAATLALASIARAQHLGDIVLDIDAGRIRTNQLDLGGTLSPNIRAFRATLGAVFANFTNSPGFDSLPGTFPTPSSNGFRILKSLRLWNGQRFVRIPGPDPQTLEVSFATLGPITSPACDTPAAGFSLTVGSNGQWHRHLEFTLPQPATPGVYLLELDLASTSPSLIRSRPFWLVILQPATAGQPSAGENASHDAAFQWVLSNRVPQLCAADFNASGAVGVPDIFAFLSAWFTPDPDADFNGDCTVNVSDIFAFLSAWFAGCP